MALPKEPRQKMINIMYLVLTALLALNVSAEILNAFKTVERSLTTTNTTINASTDAIFRSLQEKTTEAETAEKAKKWYPLAQQAIALTKGMNDEINKLKSEIMSEAGFDPAKKKGDSSFKEDNQEIATNILVKQGKGKQLQEKLAAYKKAMSDLINQAGLEPDKKAEMMKDMQSYLQQINLETPPSKQGNKSWESVYFYMVPTVAATTILTKFQNDIKTSENRIVAMFHEQVGKVVIRYDSFAAIVGQSSNYIMPGQDVEVSAGVGAFSKAATPEITINGQPTALGPDGQAVLKVKGGGLGKHAIPVVIRFKDQEGKIQTVNKNVEYTVGQSSSAIELPEMNVLYIGYPNRIKVSASGVGAEKVDINISAGNKNKVAPGEFIVNVGQQSDNFIVTAVAEGKTVGSSTFRVRNMPSPAATVGGKKSGDYVSAAAMAAQAGVGAYIENFPLNLKYTVVKFNAVGVDEEGNVIKKSCSGNAFTGEARNMIKAMRSGDILTIEDIYCTGPDGRQMRLPSLLYNIN